MELFSYTKITSEAAAAVLATVISNINDSTKSATDGVGKATAVRAFGNARQSGQINDHNGQIIGRAIRDDLVAIANNAKRSDINRTRAAKAVELFDKWRKDYAASKVVATVADPVVPPKVMPVTKPKVTATPTGGIQAASLADLTAMVMSLHSAVELLVSNR
tara:strand:+ start:487 stop:972 length:486 start_codon:yes stop_codon:yes gene_type:complete